MAFSCLGAQPGSGEAVASPLALGVAKCVCVCLHTHVHGHAPVSIRTCLAHYSSINYSKAALADARIQVKDLPLHLPLNLQKWQQGDPLSCPSLTESDGVDTRGGRSEGQRGGSSTTVPNLIKRMALP